MFDINSASVWLCVKLGMDVDKKKFLRISIGPFFVQDCYEVYKLLMFVYIHICYLSTFISFISLHDH